MPDSPIRPIAAHSRREFLALLCCSGIAGAMPRVGLAAATDVIDRDGSYPGMADSADWRREALSRIEQSRKQDFSVTLTEKSGTVLADVQVEFEHYRHEFGFGGGIRLERFFGGGRPQEQRARYQELAETLFHKVVSLNALKWKHFDRNEPYVEAFLDWSAANEMPVRGHTLVWSDFGRAPAYVEKFRNDKEGLRKAIREHIQRMVSRFEGRIAEWDVLNEPYSQHTYMDLLGDEIVVEWFRQVEELDPSTVRYINDYGVLTRVSEAHRDYYYDYIASMLRAGAPIQGIGFQAHNPSKFELTAPDVVLGTLDKFAGLGLPLQVTEFDVESRNEDLQARYTEDFLIAIFSHPATVGLMTWTPFEYDRGAVAKPVAAFCDRHMRKKPNFHAWNDLVNDRWRTKVTARTDAEGSVSFRGFAGHYEARIGDGRTKQTINLNEGERSVVLAVD